jgi:hypothetical protein
VIFFAMGMRARVRHLSWFDGLDALQPLGNCSHVRNAKRRRLLTNLVYTMQGIRRDQQRISGKARLPTLVYWNVSCLPAKVASTDEGVVSI